MRDHHNDVPRLQPLDRMPATGGEEPVEHPMGPGWPSRLPIAMQRAAQPVNTVLLPTSESVPMMTREGPLSESPPSR